MIINLSRKLLFSAIFFLFIESCAVFSERTNVKCQSISWYRYSYEYITLEHSGYYYIEMLDCNTYCYGNFLKTRSLKTLDYNWEYKSQPLEIFKIIDSNFVLKVDTRWLNLFSFKKQHNSKSFEYVEIDEDNDSAYYAYKYDYIGNIDGFVRFKFKRINGELKKGIDPNIDFIKFEDLLAVNALV